MTAQERVFQSLGTRVVAWIAALLIALLIVLSIAYDPPMFPNNDHVWMAYYTM